MTRIIEELRRPYERAHYELIKAGRDGTYWRAADGLIVRLAAAETVHQAESVARVLLDLAVRYATGK
jgi:hypothetical protein